MSVSRFSLTEKVDRFFYFLLLTICIAAFAGRMYHVNTYSLWIDEIYTMFAIHPSLTVSQILTDQGAHQPPLFFMISRAICEVFSYDAYYIRVLSIIFGALSVWVMGLVGKEMFNGLTGLFLALLTAANRMHMYYSVDARFYAIEFFFSALTILFFYRVVINGKTSIGNNIGLATGLIFAAYFHHFGLIPAFILFLVALARGWKDWKGDPLKALKMRTMLPFIYFAIALVPWLLNGLAKGARISSYWLKEINIRDYVLLGFNYNAVINVMAGLLVVLGCLMVWRRSFRRFSFLFWVPFAVIIIPVAYSYLKFPILVPRYSIVMYPYIFAAMGLSLYSLFSLVRAPLASYAVLFFSLVFSLPGLHTVFVNPSWLEKSHWREAGESLKSGLANKEKNWVVYSPTSGVRDFAAIDYFLDYRAPKSRLLEQYQPGEEPNLVLVEAASYYRIPDSTMDQVRNIYHVDTKTFGSGSAEVRIHYCVKK